MLTEQERDDTIGRVHRLLSQWPSDDSLPSEGIDGVKSIYKKLVSGLNEVKTNAERDAEYVRRTFCAQWLLTPPAGR